MRTGLGVRFAGAGLALLVVGVLGVVGWGPAGSSESGDSGVPGVMVRPPADVLLRQAFAEGKRGPVASLVYHEATIRNRTPYILANRERLRAMPVDGLTVNIPASWAVMTGERWTYEDSFASWVEPLIEVFEDTSLGCDTNYLMAIVDRPGDWLEDWSVSIANFGDLARLAKDGGFVGIALDNEQYGGRVWNWPEDAAQPGLGYAAYAAAAREKGLEIGAVMRDAFPEIRVLLLHGPYIADGDVPNDIRRNQFGVGEFELFGPFYAGLLEGVGERGRVIDGGEVYALRDAGEFARHAHWRRWTLSSATHDAAFLDEADRARHRSRGEVSFGVYPREFPAGFVMSPSILRTTLEHAMRHSERVTWLYSEEGLSAWEPDEFDAGWLEAVVDARRNASVAPPDPKR